MCTLYHFILFPALVFQRNAIISIFQKVQRRVALCIMEAFHTSKSWGVEAIAGLISIYFYLGKISRGYHL